MMMITRKICALMIGLFSVCGLYVLADTVDVPDTYGDTSNTFDVAEGTVVDTNGVLIVYEGELSLTTNIVAETDSEGRLLASTQVNIEMTLFTELPEVDLFTNAQATVVGLLNESSTTDGTLYALADVDGTASWVQLTNSATSTPMEIAANTTNLITVVMRYPNETYTDYEYTVAISEYDSQTNESGEQTVSQTLSSVIQDESPYGINEISLVGEGAIASLSSTSGDPAPLSASVDFAVYQSTNGLFVVKLYTVDENGGGNLDVYAKIDDQWVLLGSVPADGSNVYTLTVSGLTLGESYYFKVVDEEDRTHYSQDTITVKNIEMKAVSLDLDTFTIKFNAEANRTYQVVISPDLSAPLSEWEVESVEVYIPATSSWSSPMTRFNGSSEGTTHIRVPRNAAKAFFKILMLTEDEPALGNIP
ncbi:MAG: hypothetical protein R6V06_10475 [Kiritimatiellia bacterium]